MERRSITFLLLLPYFPPTIATLPFYGECYLLTMVNRNKPFLQKLVLLMVFIITTTLPWIKCQESSGKNWPRNILEDPRVCFLPWDNGTRKTHTQQHKYSWILKPVQSESTCSLPHTTHSRMWVTLGIPPTSLCCEALRSGLRISVLLTVCD